MRQSCGQFLAVTQIPQPRLCLDAARSERCGLSRDRLPRVRRARKAHSFALPRNLSMPDEGAEDRGYRLRIRRLEVGLEVEIQRSELQPRFELKHDVPLVVREPDFCAPVFGEDAFRLDYWLNHDRIKGSGGDFNSLLAENADADRVAIRTEVAIKVVGFTDDERNRADKVEERAVIEWLTDGLLFLLWLLRCLNEDRAFRVDLESSLYILPAFLQLLNETERGQRLGVHPALVDVVHAIEEIASLHPERSVPGSPPSEVVKCNDFHMGVSNSQRAELHVVLHALASPEWNLGALSSRRYDSLRRCGRR